ncbi:MAG: type IX secretion system sortase PorU [Bacteroidota bacterium]
MSRRFCILLAFALVWRLGIAQSSVLATGDWYKIGVTESGMYKISRSTLDALGISNIGDPTEIQLYGNGVKGELPQENSAIRPVDLIENAILVEGQEDGRFDDNDYILFYAVGPHKKSWTTAGFDFSKNIYADTSYYFLRLGTEGGKRIAIRPSLEDDATTLIEEYDDHITFELDERNLISSGRNWLGEIISSGDQFLQQYEIQNISSEINGFFSFASQSPEEATLTISGNSQEAGTLSLESIRTGEGSLYSLKASQAEGFFSLPQAEDFELNLSFQSSGLNARGFLDRYFLTFQRELRQNGPETQFRSVGAVGNKSKYVLQNQNEANLKVWNVSDPTNYFQQEYQQTGQEISFVSSSEEIEEFVSFEAADLPTPFVFGAVRNQNLRGDLNYDGLIVAPPQFLSEANRLADFHRKNDGLAVKVVTPRSIYNEFSSGRQDVTAIRDYARLAYTNGNLKYLLLFGDCSYDYKDRLRVNTNFVPTYESRDSFDPIYSHSSDDYYGFFEANEGFWEESRAGDHTLEIGIGRLPVKTLEESRAVVDKIIYYSTSATTLGNWKHEVTYVADDEDGNVHLRHVEDLSEIIDTTYAAYSLNKLFLDSFDQISNGSEEVSPQTAQSLKNKIREGSFVINFIGHGNERVWTEEEVLSNEDIEVLNNRSRLPIFVTATCEFGRYDDPFQVSGAERLLLKADGGAIALLTTSRPVFASTNFPLNQAFHENIFRKVDGSFQRLGDVIRATKNDGLAGAVNRNFTLLGDPMLLPAFPKLDIDLSSFELDTISALDQVVISGAVNQEGVLREDFNGTLSVVIHDVEETFRTRGQGTNIPFPYELRTNAIFRGEATVTDGRFSFSFIAPKNISYQFAKGKISIYAADPTNNLDAAGSSRSFIIGGTNPDPLPDNDPPQINMFMNSPSFSNGGIVGRNALLIANLEDLSGISTASSGVVKGISLEINNERFNLNEFYTAALDDFTKGTIVYPLQDLEPDRYKASLTVWDTHNNAATTSIDFVVSDKNELFVYNELFYPNPIPIDQEFKVRFEHDRQAEDVNVDILIYNGLGETITKQTYLFQNSGREVTISVPMETNGRSRLNQGIYYCRMIISSNFDGATKEITRKLVVSN